MSASSLNVRSLVAQTIEVYRACSQIIPRLNHVGRAIKEWPTRKAGRAQSGPDVINLAETLMVFVPVNIAQTLSYSLDCNSRIKWIEFNMMVLFLIYRVVLLSTVNLKTARPL